MINGEALRVSVATALAAPACIVLALGAAAFVRLRLGEKVVGNATIVAATVSFVTLGLANLLFFTGDREPIRLSILPVSGDATFALDLLIDERSMVFAAMAALICAVVAVFGHRYLHKEPGFYRYFINFNLFTLGILLIGVAGSTSLLFAGWEFLGISSALLVAFFQDRPMPVRNAMRVFTVYRLSDAAMLSAAVIAHNAVGSARLDLLFLGGEGSVPLGGPTAFAIALLLALAAAGKCAQLPFSGWLPRAMEGPTPSSAIFYGALAIHAGAFVLMRAGEVLEQAPAARLLIIAMGATTAAYAALVGRVQTDVKSSLAFAALTQVSIILVEVALGLYWIALAHMAGHAFLRLLQFLRAPSVLHDFHEATNARGGGHLVPAGGQRLTPTKGRPALYRFALERGDLDAAIDRFLVGPFGSVTARMDAAERRICALVAGEGEALRTVARPMRRGRRDD